MKTTVTKHEFINAFDEMGRSDNFSREARAALFDYFEQYEEGCDTCIEFDPIAICCDWSEYGSAVEWAKDYYTEDQYATSLMEIDAEDDQDIEDDFKEELQENTQVIEFEGGILVMAF